MTVSALRVVLLPGSVLPADLAYGGLVAVLGADVETIVKDLEVYRADTPPPDYSLDPGARSNDSVPTKPASRVRVHGQHRGRAHNETSLCQVLGEACSCAGECGPVLAGVKVGPARARGAGPGGAPPGLRLRAGSIGACQEQAVV
jgi:hypothetical protein